MPAVWLIVQGGRAHGKSIAVTGPQFVIGRDASCQLRPRSEAISRKHAALEWREGRWVLSDLGSTNGTALNGRLLRSKSAEVHHGDLIRIGPVAFTLAIDQPQADVGLDDLIASWLKDEMPEAHSAAAEIAEETAIYPLAETPEAGFSVRHEVIEDILVVTPVVSALDDEATVGQLRAELRGLYERALPRWVVVNLEYVGHLSSKAVGVLVAHHLRLDRAGGALRIGQPRAPVMAMLDQIRLPVLIECYPTLDEAVLEPWPGAAVRREAR
jgi:anti-anti-sigma factor